MVRLKVEKCEGNVEQYVRRVGKAYQCVGVIILEKRRWKGKEEGLLLENFFLLLNWASRKGGKIEQGWGGATIVGGGIIISHHHANMEQFY